MTAPTLLFKHGLLVACLVISTTALSQTIDTYAGNGIQGFSGDNGSAPAASLAQPGGTAVDAAGNLYIADTVNNRIRRVDATTQNITTLAGSGSSLILYAPTALAFDSHGNLFVADQNHHVIQQVDLSTGALTVVAGILGVGGFSGEGAFATSALLAFPEGIAFDASDNLYISDMQNRRIRKVDAVTRLITTVAGNGVNSSTGNGGPALNATLSKPYGLVVDGAGYLYIADSGASTVRRINLATNIIDVFAGVGTSGYSGDGGPAVSAELRNPTGLALDGAGALFIAEYANNDIRRIDASTSTISTVVNRATLGAPPIAGFSGDAGPAISAQLFAPSSVSIAPDGTGYIADTLNNRIRRVVGLGQTPDVTPPSIVPVITGAVGANGWYTGAVQVTWTVTDPESAVSNKNGCDPTNVLSDTAGTVFTCAAMSAGGTANRSVTIKRDATPPLAVVSALPLPNVSGWNRSAVTVHFTGTDAVSGIAFCTPDTTVSSDGVGQASPPGTCTDNAGNVSAAVTATGINIDTTPPSVTAIASPAPNSTGWNTTAVTVTFTGADGLSGIGVGSCTPPVILSSDGPLQSAMGQCTDIAGNVGVASVTGIKIDSSVPTASAIPVPPPNANGWNNTAVTVTFAGTDSLSGSGVAGCAAPTVIAADGSAQLATGVCTDLAGNVSAPSVDTVNIDTVPPVVTLVMPPPHSGWPTGFVVASNFTCTDALSGVAAGGCVGPVASGASIDTSLAGQKSFVVTASDQAGNTSSASADYLVSSLNLGSPGSIWTLAGNGMQTFDGDDVPAIGAGLSSPQRVTVDSSGNVYIADQSNGRIRKVTPAGVISTVAGNGAAGYSGDGGPATDASLNNPSGVAVDVSGNLFIADFNNYRVRRVDAATGVISTIAGVGTYFFSGDGGPAIAAGLAPSDLSFDAAGDLFLADSANHRVRRIDASTGIISTVAGNGTQGFSGDGGPATAASLANPQGVAVSASGDLYIADNYNQRIRKVSAAGVMSTVAGTGTLGFAGDNGPAPGANLASPVSVAVDISGNLFIADEGNHRVRKVSTSGVITTVAGSGAGGSFRGDGGLATAAGLNFPHGVTFDQNGDLYIADRANQRIRRVAGVSPTPPLVLTAPSAGTVFAPGQTFNVTWSGGNPAWLVSVTLIDNNINAGVSFLDSLPNSGAVAWTLAAGLDCTHTYRFVLANQQRTAFNYGENFTVSCGDTTPPVVEPTVSGTQGNNGWYTSNVSVTWTVTDPESAISIKTGCDSGAVLTDTTGQTFTCSATSGGGTSSRSVTIKRDATPPLAIATPSPVPNSNGWNGTTVTVHFTGSDATSGIANCSADVSLTAEGANQASTSGSCTDNAGNVSSPITAGGINIDKTAPVVTGISAPAPGASGWNTGPVSVSFTAIDGLSGVAPGACGAPTVVSGDGHGLSAGGACVDRAGNVGSGLVGGINIDTTRPVAAASINPSPNANGWNNTNVTVSFNGSDALSGSGIASCTPSVLLATEGTNQSANGSCQDVAGLLSAQVSAAVNIDKTPPTTPWIFFPVPNDGFVVGETPTALFSCTDALSGIASCVGTAASGAAINTSVLGPSNFSVTATDQASNISQATRSYSVNPPGTIIITTFAGGGAQGALDGQPANEAAISNPYGVSVDSAGNVYTSESSSVRKISAAGAIFTFAGSPTVGGSDGDGGPATNAHFNLATGLASDASGNLYIADTNNHRIRKVTSDGTISTVAGNGAAGFSGDGGAATSANLNSPFGVGVDASGNLYIADEYNNRIRKVTPSGIITTIAGNGVAGFAGDGGAAANASLSYPRGVCVDAAGNVYIADTSNSRIRKVTPNGVISTAAGDGTSANLSDPNGVAVDAAGNLYIADSSNNRVKEISPSGSISILAGNGTYGFVGDGGPAINAVLSAPLGISVDATGNPYFADSNNNRIRRIRDTTFSLSPMAVFPGQSLNVASAFKAVRLTNRGVVTITSAVPAITGANANQFLLGTNGCFSGAVPTRTCDVQVAFRPTSTGVKTAVLTVAASSGQGSKSVLLYGTGGTSYTLSPSPPGPLAFGYQAVGAQSAAKTVTVTNIGSLSLPINGVTIGAPFSRFTTIANNCGVSLAAGSSCSIGVVFTPGSTVAQSANLTVQSGGGAGNQTVTLTGQGIVPTFSVALSPPNFGNQAVGVASAPSTLTVTNTGTLTLSITGMTAKSGNTGQFTNTINPSCASVASGSTCTILVTFTPSTAGAKSAVFSVNAGGGAISQPINYTGNGVVPIYTLTPASIAFGRVARNTTSAVNKITVTNSGAIPLTITSLGFTVPTQTQFSLVPSASTCGSTLAVGQSCLIGVQFNPSGTVGIKNAAIKVAVGGGAVAQPNVTLTGTAF